MLAAPVKPREAVQLPLKQVSRPVGVPWFLWCGVAGICSSSIGIWWDISWHISIGRDTFWTPAHMAIYLCGVLAAITCGYLILRTTFGRDAGLRAASVQVLGFHAPLGAFLAAWGGVAMFTSAPFDNWWHAAYGLDAQIVTPPHTLLLLGMRAVTAGMVLLVLAAMNRAARSGSANLLALQRLLFFAVGLFISDQMVLVIPFTTRNYLHFSRTYLLVALLVVPVLAVLSQVSRYRWSATAATSVYTVLLVSMILIFPLFPAHPRSGPIYTQVTHLVPPSFPMLLMLPALALDLFWQRARSWRLPFLAAGTALLFTGVLAAAEWPFAEFLLSPRSENRFFGTAYRGFNARPQDNARVFHQAQHGLPLATGLAESMLLSFFAAWVAMVAGRWLREVQR